MKVSEIRNTSDGMTISCIVFFQGIKEGVKVTGETATKFYDIWLNNEKKKIGLA